ncbi:H/ACA snoRNP pseudouridylase subunit [Glugoides intestinalis]
MAQYSKSFTNDKKKFNNQKNFSTETVPLGSFLHVAGEAIVLKLKHRDIPYPNSPVLFNKKQVGKIEEVFGPVSNVYVSFKLEPAQKLSDFGTTSTFEAYKDKFINKEKFLPREEVEKRKDSLEKKKVGGNNNRNGNGGNNRNGNGGNNRSGNGGNNRSGNGGNNRSGNGGNNRNGNGGNNRNGNDGNNRNGNDGNNYKSSRAVKKEHFGNKK